MKVEPLTYQDRERLREKTLRSKKWATLPRDTVLALLDEIDWLEAELKKIVTHESF